MHVSVHVCAMYVCIHMCLHVHVSYIHARLHVHVCLHMYACAYVIACVYACASVCACMFTCVCCVRACVFTRALCVHMFTCVSCVRVFTCARVYECMYAWGGPRAMSMTEGLWADALGRDRGSPLAASPGPALAASILTLFLEERWSPKCQIPCGQQSSAF